VRLFSRCVGGAGEIQEIQDVLPLQRAEDGATVWACKWGLGSLSTDESTVMFVDMHTGMSTDLLRSNNLSFTDAGDEMMATRWMAALEESGVISTGG